MSASGGSGDQDRTGSDRDAGGAGATRAGAASAATPPGSLGALVNTTKSAANSPLAPTLETVDTTEELPSLTEARRMIYLLQDTSRKLLPHHRVSGCFWCLARGEKSVLVKYSPAHSRANYRRLAVCGSIFACPVCSARITSIRAEELRAALVELDKRGGSAAFGTMTVSHHESDSLASTLGGFLAALHTLTSWRGYKELRARFGVIGHVRVLEATHGRNGWHPHVHLLLCFDQRRSLAEVKELEELLYPLWSRAAAKQGLTMSRRYGLELKPAYGVVEEYLQKYGRGPRWDVASELAKGHQKRGRSIAGLKHLTPWELLAAAAGGDGRCAHLFREFVEHFSGKAQLYWSPGLRAALLPAGLDLTDLELAASVPADSLDVGEIPEALWGAIRRAKERTRPLELVEEAGGSWELVPAYLEDVARRFPPAPAFVPRDLTKLPPELVEPLAQMRRDQAERIGWRGPLLREAGG